MSMKAPLNGSVTGRPITISDSVVTPVHTSPAAQSSALKLSVINTTAGALTVTLDVGGVQAAFSLAANAIEHIQMAVSAGDALGMQGSAVGLRVVGWNEGGNRQIA